MKKYIVLLIIVLLAAGAVIAGGQQEDLDWNYFVISETNGTAVSNTGVSPEFADAGLEGWSVLNDQAAGIDFYIFEIAPGADEYPVHSSPDEWYGYVLKGGGELSLGDEEGIETGAVKFSKGDYLIFESDTMHGWRNGTETTQLLFLKTLN